MSTISHISMCMCIEILGDQYNRAFEVAIDICFNDVEDDDGGDCEKARGDADA